MNDLLRARLTSQLKRDEGDPAEHPRLLKLYYDSRKVPTLGIGHNIRDRPISIQAAEVIFNDDLREVEEELAQVWPFASSLSEARYGVVLNMAFNLGTNGLAKFHRFRAALEEGDWNRACDEMRESDWFVQVGDRVLRLIRQMRLDAWQ